MLRRVITMTDKLKRSIIKRALKAQKSAYGKTYVKDLKGLTLDEMKEYTLFLKYS